MKVFWIVLFNLLCTIVYSQQIRYKFRISYEDNTLLANTNFLINGEDYGTDSQGIIDKQFPSGQAFVQVRAKPNNNYYIVYPKDGIVLLPKESNALIDITVKRGNAPAQETINYRILDKQIKASVAMSENRILQALRQESRGLDSILNILNNDFSDKKIMKEGRLRNLPLISSALNHYLNEVRDLSDAFASLAFDLDQKKNYDQYAQAINSYNEIFELLNTNKGIYEQAVEVYWHKELALKLSNVIDFTIEEIHRPYILESNYTFQGRLYEYAKETNKKKKGLLGVSLKNDMKTQVQSISRRINILGERISSYNTLLNNYVQ